MPKYHLFHVKRDITQVVVIHHVFPVRKAIHALIRLKRQSAAQWVNTVYRYVLIVFLLGFVGFSYRSFLKYCIRLITLDCDVGV